MRWLWWGGKGPRDLPEWAYFSLVRTLQVESDRLAGLKCVEQVGFVEDVPVVFTRIFDPRAAEETARIKDFASLDLHPELILYEGYLEKGTERVLMVRGRGVAGQPGGAAAA